MIINTDFEFCKLLCIPPRHRSLDQTTKQPLSSFEPQRTWKYKQISGLRPEPSGLLKKISGMSQRIVGILDMPLVCGDYVWD